MMAQIVKSEGILSHEIIEQYAKQVGGLKSEDEARLCSFFWNTR